MVFKAGQPGCFRGMLSKMLFLLDYFSYTIIPEVSPICLHLFFVLHYTGTNRKHAHFSNLFYFYIEHELGLIQQNSRLGLGCIFCHSLKPHKIVPSLKWCDVKDQIDHFKAFYFWDKTWGQHYPQCNLAKLFSNLGDHRHEQIQQEHETTHLLFVTASQRWSRDQRSHRNLHD